MPIYPKSYREKVGAEGYAKAPVGAGPYRILKFEAGKEVVFERFEKYWHGSPKGKPAIKTIHVRWCRMRQRSLPSCWLAGSIGSGT